MDSIRFDCDSERLFVLDQRLLPFEENYVELQSLEEAVEAISTMTVRSAPLIGVTAAFGFWLAARGGDDLLHSAYDQLLTTRPTAINLKWALDRQMSVLKEYSSGIELERALLHQAIAIHDLEIETCRAIGEAALTIFHQLESNSSRNVIQVLTHCNAGSLACVKYGTATSPIYLAHEQSISVHVWVDETRPRLQGAKLTAYELGKANIPHTVIVDGAAAWLMSQGKVDVVLVGADRVSKNGDVCNKIGTYGVALAARANTIPFYTLFPSSTIDCEVETGSEIPIELRDETEVSHAIGSDEGRIRRARISPESSSSMNFAFDVTPAELITGYVTEKGILSAEEICSMG